MKNNVIDQKGDYSRFDVEREQSLLEFLLENVKGQSRSKIKATLQGHGVFVGKTCVTQFDYMLKPGMRVSVSNTKRNLNMLRSRYFKIVYEDRYIVVVDKSVGILSMAAGHSSLNVKAVLDDYFRRSRQRCNAHVVHRLDRDTSGLMIYAKDMQAEQMLERNWHDMVYGRRYVALLSGRLEQKEGTIANWLKDSSAYVTYSSNVDNGGKYAVTHFYTIGESEKHSLVEFRLETGRKNQIRVHAADMGHPVCGDIKYGNGDDPAGRLCLHAFVLCFHHPVTREKMEFSTPVPQSFINVLKKG
ncbi:RluA family pseudouridine synthase [Prevotella sp. OH937_COT-195]|uniref:RluA family pseudouridine synthase n=1 Tax=Prevotella sp. OH937_COT-195 TaxID=2491051 RepID=UPI000F64FA18|nr:RluA family pseudouridine synthase [Prevotella sp. OH937_COT-195]RRD00315.1 RluA family pseudouridine synthase [Prevotella sp. OH937_COT-195]